MNARKLFRQSSHLPADRGCFSAVKPSGRTGGTNPIGPPLNCVGKQGLMRPQKMQRGRELDKWVSFNIVGPNFHLVFFYVFDLVTAEALNMHITVCIFFLFQIIRENLHNKHKALPSQ